jgi:hypothetical protein
VTRLMKMQWMRPFARQLSSFMRLLSKTAGVEGQPEIQLIATPDDLPPLPPDQHDTFASALIPPAAAVFVTQRVTGPLLPTAGLIGTSLTAQTKERLFLARVIDHPGESGRAREEAIRQHIQEFLPGDLRLETGFVVCRVAVTVAVKPGELRSELGEKVYDKELCCRAGEI